MTRLIDAARRCGFARLTGVVLSQNQSMLRFAESLGFEVREDPGDPEQVIVELPLRSGDSARIRE